MMSSILKIIQKGKMDGKDNTSQYKPSLYSCLKSFSLLILKTQTFKCVHKKA